MTNITKLQIIPHQNDTYNTIPYIQTHEKSLALHIPATKKETITLKTDRPATIRPRSQYICSNICRDEISIE